MTENTPPKIFDARLIRLRRERAARRPASFLAQRAAEDAAERLCDINRQFNQALIIGLPEFYEALLKALPPHKIPLRMQYCADHSEAEKLPPQSFDLIISGFCLHHVDDLPGALIAAHQLLEPDGLFIAAIFGGETLTEMRRCAYAADEAVFKGLSPRVLPFADYSQAAALLQRARLALPVVDTDRLTLRYRHIDKLLSDIRDMGEASCLLGRDKRPLGKAWRAAFIDHYQDNYAEAGRLVATSEILWLTGWAPHESQQKPLKPGSAKMRLADALGAIEKNPLKP